MAGHILGAVTSHFLSAKRLEMVQAETGVYNEGTTWVCMVDKKIVGASHVCHQIKRLSLVVVFLGHPEPVCHLCALIYQTTPVIIHISA